jgi:hypothetical protein
VVSDLFKKAQDLVEENASAILTAVGVVGTVSTAVLTGRASFKAAQLISDEEDRRIRKLHEQPSDIDMSNPIQLELKDKVMLVWPQYIPATGVGTLTIASIIMANRVSSNKAAALAAAYGLKDKALQEYKDKVVEKFGDKKATEVKDDIAQDRVNANPPQNIIITGAGDVLCYDSLSDRYFESTIEKIRQAENTVNFEIANHDEVSLGRFYEEIGLKVTPYSDTVGWNLNNPCKVEFSTVMTDDGRPCIAVEFASWPEVSYHKIYE